MQDLSLKLLIGADRGRWPHTSEFTISLHGDANSIQNPSSLTNPIWSSVVFIYVAVLYNVTNRKLNTLHSLHLNAYLAAKMVTDFRHICQAS